MDEHKWTQGPWIASAPMTGIGHMVCKLSSSWCVKSYQKPSTDASPDAHLIAAAPELYEALEEAAKVLKYVVEEYRGYAELLHKSNAALAKARGETRK